MEIIELREGVNRQILVPEKGDKDMRSRVGKFADWVEDWRQPDLAAYRDYLLGRGMKPTAVSANLSSVRSRYAELVRDRALFYSLVPDDMSMADRKAIVDEIIERLKNAMHPANAKVRVIKVQDVADDDRLRLTVGQANQLMRLPNLKTLDGLRDAAMIVLFLAVGIREAEMANLHVDDLRQSLGGELALRVRDGKGAKQRLIPYGDLDGALVIVEKWLAAAKIRSGYVFRGFTPHYNELKAGDTPLTTRQIQRIVGKYPITVNGRVVRCTPHALRRTYARLLYLAGMAIKAIQANMGHEKEETTWRYIGPVETNLRRAKAVYDLSFFVV